MRAIVKPAIGKDVVARHFPNSLFIGEEVRVMGKTMERHKETVKEAMRLIQAIGCDTSVGRDTTEASLSELKEEIEVRLEALSCDDTDEE